VADQARQIPAKQHCEGSMNAKIEVSRTVSSKKQDKGDDRESRKRSEGWPIENNLRIRMISGKITV
jgi:hypothetical protein